jgi:hypothetical protein
MTSIHNQAANMNPIRSLSWKRRNATQWQRQLLKQKATAEEDHDLSLKASLQLEGIVAMPTELW